MRCKAGDLRLLRGELMERVHGPLAGALARGLQLDMRALGEPSGTKTRSRRVVLIGEPADSRAPSNLAR